MAESCSLVERVVADLQGQIREGKLRPAQRLASERNLCAVFKVGRTTVREALNSLAIQGYVRRTRRGAIVDAQQSALRERVDLTALAAQTTIRDLYEVRKLLEMRVARWAAIRATTADFERLRSTVEAEHLDGDDRTNPNTAFHDALVAAAHNPIISEIHTSSHDLFYHLPFYWKLFDSTAVQSARASRHEMARRWHRQILRAVEQRDPDEAGGAMFQHLDIMEKDLLARLSVVHGDPTQLAFPTHPVLSDLRTVDDSVRAPRRRRATVAPG